MLQKRMFKVLCPIERKDGGTYWMRVGNAHTNKDDSINVYLDAIPIKSDAKLQLRELTEEELRERDSKRASYTPRMTTTPPPPAAQEPVPF